MDIRTVSLKDYSSLRIGGEGKLVEVETVEQLKEAVMHAKAEGLRVHVLGEGTNSYFSDNLSSFLFLQLRFRGCEFIPRDEGRISFVIRAGENWDEMVKLSTDRKLWGLENLSYIPGSAGAAPVQNIGAYGVELSNLLEWVKVFDTIDMMEKTFDREACQFGYRHSIFKYEPGRYVILSLSLILSSTPTPVLTYKPLNTLDSETVTPPSIREAVIAVRTEKLPDWKEYPNAGSFFKNPHVDSMTAETVSNLYPDMPLIQVPEGYKVPAAWLIEHVAHMKGIRKGDLGTWPKQPLVIVNYGQAFADDVDMFAGEIREKVNQATGIVLEQEVNRVG